jgi:hypothetical protein
MLNAKFWTLSLKISSQHKISAWLNNIAPTMRKCHRKVCRTAKCTTWQPLHRGYEAFCPDRMNICSLTAWTSQCFTLKSCPASTLPFQQGCNQQCTMQTGEKKKRKKNNSMHTIKEIINNDNELVYNIIHWKNKGKLQAQNGLLWPLHMRTSVLCIYLFIF